MCLKSFLGVCKAINVRKKIKVSAAELRQIAGEAGEKNGAIRQLFWPLG